MEYQLYNEINEPYEGKNLEAIDKQWNNLSRTWYKQFQTVLL